MTAHFRFDRVHIGRSTRPAGPFAYPLDVPGRVELPHGFALEVLAATGPASSPAESGSEGRTAVVAAPRGEPLLVRTRRPGDRVSWHGREVSLKRFLMERRVPADERPGLPLVAAGSRVLWVPGQPVEGLAGDRWLGLRLLVSGGQMKPDAARPLHRGADRPRIAELGLEIGKTSPDSELTASSAS